ncbi:MAG: hypothetical protein N4A47_01355 [Clostridia bacterium]|jgi:hypothetical protein|nr:hypothetical protein [Clostridia bacterium]
MEIIDSVTKGEKNAKRYSLITNESYKEYEIKRLLMTESEYKNLIAGGNYFILADLLNFGVSNMYNEEIDDTRRLVFGVYYIAETFTEEIIEDVINSSFKFSDVNGVSGKEYFENNIRDIKKEADELGIEIDYANPINVDKLVYERVNSFDLGIDLDMK